MESKNPDCLMMIEPKKNKTEPVLDKYTKMAEVILKNVKKGSVFKGVHSCICGVHSGNCNLHVAGKLTNSLLVHYVRDHRSEVPVAELEKLKEVFSALNLEASAKDNGFVVDPPNLNLSEKIKVFREVANESNGIGKPFRI